MDLELSGKIVCITGASEGIGLACARVFVSEGAHVIICARRPDKLRQAVKETICSNGATIEGFQADVTKVSDIEALIAHINTRYGRLDVLVNNAGTGIYKGFADVTDQELLDGMSINFFAQFPPGSSCTGPAKAAEVRFSTDLATELAEFVIRVNCVIPGVVKSEERLRLWEAQANGGAWKAEAIDKRDALESAAVPKGQRWGVSHDIAHVVAFFASTRAIYVNGAALTVDGGPHTKSYVSQLYA